MRKVLGLVFSFVLGQPAWRPVRLGSVAAARAVERGDVLQRHEDVAVQLDVRHLVDEAIRGENAFLVIAAEKGYLDALALVLAGVVLHGGQSIPRRTPSLNSSL
jgi:hypothetical protein